MELVLPRLVEQGTVQGEDAAGLMVSVLQVHFTSLRLVRKIEAIKPQELLVDNYLSTSPTPGLPGDGSPRGKQHRPHPPCALLLREAALQVRSVYSVQ